MTVSQAAMRRQAGTDTEVDAGAGAGAVTTKSRVDLGLRLDTVKQREGRLLPARDIGQATVRIALTTPGEVDDEVRNWLAKAYDENTAPPADEPKRPKATPKPVLGTLNVVIEGTELPGLTCQPEPGGTVHRTVHVQLTCRTSRSRAAS